MKLASEIITGMTSDFELMYNLSDLIARTRPKKVIETGTFIGFGSTSAILLALLRSEVEFQFYSIESNQDYHAAAKHNLQNIFSQKALGWTHLLHGLSIPYSALPSSLDMDFPDHVYTDHNDIEKYNAEASGSTDAIPDDRLSIALMNIGGRPDLVFLDSAGHIGLTEFHYLMKLIDQDHSFHLVLDDTNHRKHFKTLNLIRTDKRFTILKESTSKFGHAVIKYSPCQ